MEPLSIASSIVAVLQASRAAGQGLRRLVALKNAPSNLLELQRDVFALESTVVTVRDMTVESPPSEISSQILCDALKRAQKIVVDVQSLIMYTLTKSDQKKIDKSEWLKAAKRIDEVRSKMVRAQQEISEALTIANWSVISRMNNDFNNALKRLQLENESQGRRVEALLTTVVSIQKDPAVRQGGSPVVQRELSSEFETMMNADSDSHANRQRNAEDNDTTLTLSNTDFQGQFQSGSLTQSVRGISDIVYSRRGVSNNLTRFSTIHTGGCATISCDCSCHKSLSFRSPILMKKWLGSIHVKIAGFPALAPPCDKPKKCSRRLGSAVATYGFPQWFLNYIVSAKLQNLPFGSPELTLRVLRRRENNADIFIAVLRQNFHSVRGLLESNRASVLDVDNGGHSLMHMAIDFGGNTDFIKFLIGVGADVHQENDVGMSASLLYRYRSHENKKYRFAALEELQNHEEWEQPTYPILHAAIMNEAGCLPFEDALRLTSRETINSRDCLERTALMLACKLGRPDQASRILTRGADPNVQDGNGDSALRHSVRGGNTLACVKALLAAGANVELCNNDNVSMIGTAMVAEADVDVIELMMERITDFNTTDPDRFSIVRWCARLKGQYLSTMLQMLINKGVDITETVRVDRTLLDAAVKNRNSELLKLLFQRGTKLSNIEMEGRNVLHTAALYADIEVMKIMEEGCDFSNLDVCQLDNYGWTAEDNAIWRYGHNYEWSIAFLWTPDPDPDAWFEAFYSLWNRAREAHLLRPAERIVNGQLEHDIDLTDGGKAVMPGSFVDD